MRDKNRSAGQQGRSHSSAKVDFPEDLDLAFAAGLLSNGGLVQKPVAMATRPSPSPSTTTPAATVVDRKQADSSLQQAAHELAALYSAPPARRVEMASVPVLRGGNLKPAAAVGPASGGSNGGGGGGASFRWRAGGGMMIGGDGPSPPATVVGSSAGDSDDTSPPGFINAHVAQVVPVLPGTAATVVHDRLGGNMPALLAAAAIQLEAADADADIDYLRDFDRARRYL